MLNLIENCIPLYKISKKIKEVNLDDYDKQFSNHILFVNIVAGLMYTAIDIYEIYKGVHGYLAIYVIFIIIGLLVLAGSLYSRITLNIQYNYWFCLLLVFRIDLGLILDTFIGSNVYSSKNYAIFWTFNSYIACDVLLYLVNNISHKKNIVAPIIVHLFSVISLFICVFNFISRPSNFIDWVLVCFFSVIVILSVVYKLGLQKMIQEQVLLSMQTKQQSKEYILDIL